MWSYQQHYVAACSIAVPSVPTSSPPPQPWRCWPPARGWPDTDPAVLVSVSSRKFLCQKTRTVHWAERSPQCPAGAGRPPRPGRGLAGAQKGEGGGGITRSSNLSAADLWHSKYHRFYNLPSPVLLLSPRSYLSSQNSTSSFLLTATRMLEGERIL